MRKDIARVLLTDSLRNTEIVFDAADFVQALSVITTAKEQWKELDDEDQLMYDHDLVVYIEEGLKNRNIEFTIIHTDVINLED